MSQGRRFTPGRVILFLLIVGGMVAWEGNQKIQSGPDSGESLSGGYATTQPAGPTLRVATFNIDGGAEGIDKVAHALRDSDLAGLEEVHGLDQTDYLGQALHLSYVYAPVETQWWFKSFGNAALTDLPISYWARIPIAINGSDSNRNVILLRATFAGQPVNVLITHIDRKLDHVREIRAVSNLFLALQAPAILMGDFNITTDQNGNAADPDVAALASTPGVIDPIGKNYDRIFARGFVAVDSGFIEEHASDHPLAWAELELSK
jgi:endonuclease/exonuclease/phosphatase family metal-dependent hydrolase